MAATARIYLTALLLPLAASTSVPNVSGAFLTTYLDVVIMENDKLMTTRTIPYLEDKEHTFTRDSLSNTTHSVYRSDTAQQFLCTCFDDTKPRYMYLCLQFTAAIPGTTSTYLVNMMSRPLDKLDNIRMVLSVNILESVNDACTERPPINDVMVMTRIGYETATALPPEFRCFSKPVQVSSGDPCSNEFLNTCECQHESLVKVVQTHYSTCSSGDNSLYKVFHTETGELLPVTTVDSPDDNTTYIILQNKDTRLHNYYQSRFICVNARANSTHLTLNIMEQNCTSTSTSKTVVLKKLASCIQCGAPPSMLNDTTQLQPGVTNDGYDVGDSVNVTCKYGLFETLVCRSDGTWNVSSSVCPTTSSTSTTTTTTTTTSVTTSTSKETSPNISTPSHIIMSTTTASNDTAPRIHRAPWLLVNVSLLLCRLVPTVW